jgi:hypothetical protein
MKHYATQATLETCIIRQLITKAKLEKFNEVLAAAHLKGRKRKSSLAASMAIMT